MEYQFKDQVAFENWLKDHLLDEGIFVIFDKKKLTSSLTPEEALDVALSYGWIDGLIKRMDDQFYKKYFSKRKPKSVWSTKNKNSVERLIKNDQMKPEGMKAVMIAKENGRWDQADHEPENFSLDAFYELIKNDELAYKNYLEMSKSVQKTYAYYYFTAKRYETKIKRLDEIKGRLKDNLKPLEVKRDA